jgi:hypothetical protein
MYLKEVGRAGLAQSVYWLSYGLFDRGSIPGMGWEFFSSPPRPDRFWCPPSHLSNWYWACFPRR